MKDLEVPLARSEYSPRHVPASFYYQIPVRQIYKSYPVYHPDREPKGYIEWLRSRDPEIDWNAANLKTKEDWIRAGETVFDAPLVYGSIFLTKERLADVEDLYVRTPSFVSAVQPPVSADGILPFLRYVVRKKGAIDVGVLACAMCHTRVMPDGSVVKGAQGNFPVDKAIAFSIRSGAADTIALNRKLARLLWFTPWFEPDYFAGFDQKNYEDLARPLADHPGGVVTRHRSGPWAPIQVPDLILWVYLQAERAARRLPFVIARADGGDFTALLEGAFSDGRLGVRDPIEGMYLSVTCPEETLRIAPSDVGPGAPDFLGSDRLVRQMTACRAWPQASLPADVFEPVRTSVPALIVTGTLDPITPTPWGRGLLEYMPNARLIDVPDMSHRGFDMDNFIPCIMGLLFSFWNAGTAEGIDTSCMATMKPPGFFVPQT